MPGLTEKLFRTYKASITLDNMLNENAKQERDVTARVEVYKDANKQVVIDPLQSSARLRVLNQTLSASKYLS